MSPRLVVTATDTDVGKTVFAAALAAALNGAYWKPIQCGIEPETDRATVARLSGLPADRLPPEAYVLRTAASPHVAAETEGIAIDVARLEPPATDRPLVIEGAGGLMVPITRSLLQIDLFARWGHPVVLCARTALGTINHTLLSLEALKRRGIPVLGVAFIGEEAADSRHTICDFAEARDLGRLPIIAPLDREALRSAFAANFRVGDFAS